MRKFALAAALAVPLAMLAEGRAAAQNCCYNIAGCFHFKICSSCKFKCWSEPFCASCPPGTCGSGGGYGYGGCGCGPGGCPPQVPGPWYLYWPYDGRSQVAGAYPGGWDYSMHFQTPAPTGYPYYPNPMVASEPQAAPPTALPGGHYQPAGYYAQGPGYWYGW